MVTWETPIGDLDSIDWNSLNGEQMLEALHIYSTQKSISDIHTSPEREGVRLEVRLHGVLQPLATLTHATYEDLVRRVKFMAKLKLNVTNLPQDGQYVFQAPDRIVNVRVASIPSRFGETFTLRLLDPNRGIVPLSQLGFPDIIANKLDEIAHMPNGLMLVTGPTGSGKTTTLYALLQSLTGKQRNIITLEDPVEYELEGIVQSEMEAEHGYNFASGLRSVLRHDPDVILVGEIRDKETATTAIDAALTGHFVLSTLHTNSAIEAIPRLLAMGVDPHTLAPALRGVLAQRLVRTLTPECKTSGTCDPADNASYNGVIAVPELLVIDENIEQMILDETNSDTITKYAKEHGYMTMNDWGGKLVEQGITTAAEVRRVTQ